MQLKTLSSILIFILVSILFSSCVTEKQRAKICNSCAVKSDRKDSVVEKIVNVPVYLPGEAGPIQYLENPCKWLCDSLGNLKKVDITNKKNGIIQNIKTIGNSLAISSSKKDTTINVALTEKSTFHSQKDAEVKYLECDKEHRTKWDGWCYWWFWISIGILLIQYLPKIWKWIRKAWIGI